MVWFLLHVCLPTQKTDGIRRTVNNMFQIAPVLLFSFFLVVWTWRYFFVVRCADYCTAQSVNPWKIKKWKVVHPPLQKSLQSDVWILTYDIWSSVLTRWTKPMLLTATSNLHGQTVLAQDREIRLFRPWICHIPDGAGSWPCREHKVDAGMTKIFSSRYRWISPQTQ